MSAKNRILHVEVGGSYGGSIRALELYLKYRDGRHEEDVLFYYPTDGTDALRELARKLFVLTGKGAAAPARPGRKRIPAALKAPIAPYVDLLRGVTSRRLIAGMADIMKENGYGVIHINNTFPYQVPTIAAARSRGLPIIAHVRNPVACNGINRRLLNYIDRVITVARFYEGQIAALDRNARVKTIHDSIELKPPGGNKTFCRGDYVDAGGLLIGSVGRLDEQKGYGYFIDGIKAYLGGKTLGEREIHFVIAGSGERHAALQRAIDRHGLGRRVTLLGFRNDVEDVLSELDVFVSTSLWEGLPIVIVEAMLKRVLTVATAVGGTPEVVVDGSTGILIRDRSVDDVRRGLEKAVAMLNDRTLRDSCVSRAFEKASALADAKANALLLENEFTGAGSHEPG